MLQRVITGALIAVVILTILFSNTAIVSAFIGVLILAAQYEISKVVELSNKIMLVLLNLAFSVALLIIVWFEKFQFISVSSAIYAVLLLTIMLFNHEKIKFTDVSLSIFCIIYITASMLHITMVRNMCFGELYIFLIFIGAFATDTCAYFVGVLFGKYKLCEKISPKKTIEGAVGGEIGNILLMVLFGYLAGEISGTYVNYFNLIILGALSGLVSQLGDLTASIIKREFGVKDYGNILPGHGGVMDRIDSIILMAPLVYYFVSYLPIFMK